MQTIYAILYASIIFGNNIFYLWLPGLIIVIAFLGYCLANDNKCTMKGLVHEKTYIKWRNVIIACVVIFILSKMACTMFIFYLFRDFRM